MKPMLTKHQATGGFALPTVIIASVILLTILVTSVTAVGSVTSSLANQYYNQLAREAAESGLANARACLRYFNYSPTWTDATPLKPNTGCYGEDASPVSAYIVNANNIRSTFSVPAPTVGVSSSLRIISTGTVQLTRASDPNQVWRTYTYVAAENSRYNDVPQIAGGAGWKSNGHDGYMLAANGTLYGWGDNSGQQLGDSSLGSTVSTPVKIAPPDGVSKIKKVYNSGQGASILCIVATHSSLGDQAYCRGIPGAGENGLMPLTPDWQRFVLPAGLTAIDMSVNGINGFGADSACVRASDLQAYCAGINDSGGLGTGTTSNTPIPLTAPVKFRLDLANPGPISGSASSLTVQKVFNQDRTTCVIASDNQAYCAGDNNYGQLGQNNFTVNVGSGKSTPGRAQIPGNPSVFDVLLTYHGAQEGVFFHVNDSPSSTLYMSGNNSQGTASDGSFSGSCAVSSVYNCYSVPRALTTGIFGRTLSIGEQGADKHAVCVIAKDRSPPDSGVWCTGQNSFGELGTGSCSAKSSWYGMLNFNGETALYGMNTEATYQMNSVMYITTAGNVYAMGDNTYGKLGTGAALQACNPNPAKVQLSAGVKATAIANGDEYTAFILGDNGKVYAVGRNNNGQLGDGTTTDRSTPVEVKIPRQETIY